MKFGTLYSYWGTKWQCDYLKTLKRVSDIGFDILEMGAPHLLEMSDYELSELRRAAKDMDMVLTANIGPAKDKDLASPDPDIRKAGVNYLIDILKAMEKVGSKSLVGAMYSYWPCQFEITVKEAAWERSIEGMKEVAEAAESLGIECCQEVLNRYETYIITDCREGLEYCRRVGSENVNLLLDTFHMNIEEDDMVEAILLAGDRLGHFHVGENNRRLPGKGGMPWYQIGSALRAIGYDKNVVMEPFVRSGGGVGSDIKVWRDLSKGADEQRLDLGAAASVAYLRNVFSGPNSDYTSVLR